MWDLIALQDAYQAELDVEADQARKHAQMKNVQQFLDYQRHIKNE